MPTGPTGRATRAHRRTSLAARRLQSAYPIPQGQRSLSGSTLKPKPGHLFWCRSDALSVARAVLVGPLENIDSSLVYWNGTHLSMFEFRVEKGPRLRCRSSSTAHELRHTSPRLEAPLIRLRTSE